jgi:N-acetylneuraminate synthase/N,N'-diacetyllegionaminate synthase
MKIKIGSRFVGSGEPAFIIAEAGANHNRDFDMAKKLIDVAADSKADAVKFQTYSAETLYSKKTPEFSYMKGQNVYDLIKSIELPREWQQELAEYADQSGIMFLSTPFDYAAVDELDEIGVPAFKFASFEIVDPELLKYAASKQKPMIISTGMANLGEIEDAISAIRSAGNDDIVLLHCNSLYPTPPEVVNLRAMGTMREAFKLPVGFSDHTLGIHISLAAVAMGACVIEKHFTLDRNLPGPDHSFAIEPDELKEMVRCVREIEEAKGSGIKEKSKLEGKEQYLKARRSIHAKVDIPKGTKITKDMLVVKRPGCGIKPKFMDVVVGRTARMDIKEEEWIAWEMV